MTTKKFFHAGGPISAREGCYIIRPCEQVVLDDIDARPAQRQYVSLLGSRQVGKTSLLYRIRGILNRRKIPNAVVDLRPLQKLEAGSSYNQLASEFIVNSIRVTSTKRRSRMIRSLLLHF